MKIHVTDYDIQSWSDELASIADRWANRCVFDHDSYDNRKTKLFPQAGQNIYAGWEPKE